MINQLDISVIILTYNENLHLKRCIENVRLFAKDIYIVDSYSIDDTLLIANELNVHIYQNKWENNYAKQFNWALNNLPIRTKWVLRLDADEYLLPELIKELENKLSNLNENISGIIFNRRLIFLNKWIKKGVYPVKLLRLFKYKKAFCETRLMDEHIKLTEGFAVEFENDFVDHNLNDISSFILKHNGYSIREAIDLLDIEFNLFDNFSNNELVGQASQKRKLKHIYAYKPLFLRSFIYFFYRYIIKLGFIEGKEAFIWHFFQGWWYRTLVDMKIFEIKQKCFNNKDEIKKYIREHYNMEL